MSKPFKIDIDSIGLESKFQSQMVYYDLNKTFRHRMAKMAIDYLIIDFTSEKRDILKILPSGGYITHSNEFVKSELSTKLKTQRLTKEKKSALWEISIESFVKTIYPLIQQKKVILHEVYSADKYIEDGELKEFKENKERIEKNNLMLEKCYRIFKELAGENLKVISLRGDKTHVSDPNHKWGPGAGHFIKDYYMEAFKILEEHIK